MIYGFTRTILIAVCLALPLSASVNAQGYRSDNWFPVMVNGKAGYIDRTGKIVLEPKYDGASYFSEGLARVSVGRDTIITEGFSQGYIDETGKVVIAPQWDVVSHFSEGLAAVGYDQTKQAFKLGNKTFYTSASHTWYRWGFIDKTGNLVIEPKFSEISEFRDGIAVAAIPIMSEWKYGFIDRTGNWVLSPKFDHAKQFSEGLARVFVNGKYGYIDRLGNLTIPAKYSSARDFSEGLACVKLGGDVIKPKGVSVTRNNADYAFVDTAGKVKFKVGKGECESFSEGLARVSVGPRHRVIDKIGKFVFDPSLEVWSNFKYGLARVYLAGNEIGIIDKSGKITIRKPFGMADDFYRGLAEVCESYDFGAKCGYINKEGEIVWQPSK